MRWRRCSAPGARANDSDIDGSARAPSSPARSCWNEVDVRARIDDPAGLPRRPCAKGSSRAASPALESRGRGGSSAAGSVLALAERSDCDKRHAHARGACWRSRIFDQTRELHALDRRLARVARIRRAAARERGCTSSDRGYHKHSYYLDPPRRPARLHRGAAGHGRERGALLPQVDAARTGIRKFAELTPAQRGDVQKLAAILRIAEALDRSHRQSVRDVAVRLQSRACASRRARAPTRRWRSPRP